MPRRWFAILVALVVFTPAFADDKPKDEKPKSGGPKKLLKIPGYTTVIVEGFTLLISDEAKSHEEDEKYQRKPKEVLEIELKGICRVVPPKMLEKLKKGVGIFVEWDDPESKPKDGKPGTIVARYWYDSGRGIGMLQQGRNPHKANNIEILTMRHLTEKWQPGKSSEQIILLHELCHAIHTHLLPDNPYIKMAYNSAMERGLYAQVQHESGRQLRAYASTNDREYFAELSCSYLDRCAYYPFTREQLKEYDPAGYELMVKVWGNADPRSAEAKRTMKGDAKSPIAKAPPKAEKKKDDAPAAKPPAGSDDEAAAERTLVIIETLIQANRKEKAREKLKEVIEQYPGTDAAKKAKQMLEDLK
jgi:hypothetical protein